METVNIPLVQTGIWVLAVAITIVILLVMFGLYIYQRKRLKALIKDSEDVAHLAAQRDLLQAQKDELVHWMHDQKAELERLTMEREEQERIRAELNRLEQECTEKDKDNQSLRNEVGELENQRHLISQTLEKLKKEIGDLDSKRAEAEVVTKRLAELKTKLEETREAVSGLAVIQAKLEAFSAERVTLERALVDMRTAIDSAQAELELYRQQAEKARIEAEEARGALVEDRKEKAELGVILDTLRQEQTALSRDIERMEQTIDNLMTSVQTAKKDAKTNIQIANEARTDAEKAEGQLADITKDSDRLELKIGELNARKASVELEIVRLEGRIGTRPEEKEHEDLLKPYADILKVPPECLHKNAFPGGPRSEEDEVQALQIFKDQLRDENLMFPSRIIDAFHTSLKCHNINPLTVLAGVSGTGKTLLPMYYAKIMGMHSLVMAVQPRWDSPQDMFGFYNYLENEYKATELSRALVRMDPFNYNDEKFSMIDYEWARKRMLLVLLDEMNLARTEYYFSEFLSKLELRRMVKDPEDKTDRQRAEITLDIGPGKAVRFRIWMEHNVLFVGTMNEDETTQTLSDKVIDRANVLRFGKPDERAQISQIDKQEHDWPKHYLPFKRWQSWIKPFGEHAVWSEQITKWTNRLNEALNRVGRPFGYRVQLAIGTYVANYPYLEGEGRYKLAFADQLEQKIIPKLRGADLGNNAANICLDEVEAVIAELGDQKLGDAFRNTRNESQTVGMFQWRGVTRHVEDNH